MSEYLTPIINLVAVIVGGWLLHRIKTPTDQQRAALLSGIATEAAALVVSLNPTASWATLLESVIQQISSAAGVPTKNAGAIQRAAAAALTQLGKSPDAAK